jgi:hypothetical protein
VTKTVTDWTPDPEGAAAEAAEPQTPAGKAWARIVWLASWFLPPILMAGAYTILALTSDTDVVGKSFMAIGFSFVLVLWLVFRIAAESAGLSRAIAIGDSDRILAIAARKLRHTRGDAARAPYLIYEAIAHEQTSDYVKALAAASAAKPARDGQSLLALSLRILSLVGLERVAEARALAPALDGLTKRVDRRLDPLPHQYAHIARARLLAADAKSTEANAELAKVIDDIRAGVALRDRARALKTSAS